MKFPNQPLGCVRFPAIGLLVGDPHAERYWNEPKPPPDERLAFRLRNPVKLGFYPPYAVRENDEKEEGLKISDVWNDSIARTLWLGIKPFYLSSQYFRPWCVDTADFLRRRPEILLGDHTPLGGADGVGLGYDQRLLVQLVPYLIWALQQQDRWPFFQLPCEELRWMLAEPQGDLCVI